MTDKEKDNEDIGAIPSIDDDRAQVDLSGQRGKRASKGYLKDFLIFGGVIVLILGTAGAFVWKALHKTDSVEASKPVDPTLEKNAGSDTGNKGVDQLMTTIAERKAAEEREAEEKRKADEDKRMKDEQAKQKALMDQLEAQGIQLRTAAGAVVMTKTPPLHHNSANYRVKGSFSLAVMVRAAKEVKRPLRALEGA